MLMIGDGRPALRAVPKAPSSRGPRDLRFDAEPPRTITGIGPRTSEIQIPGETTMTHLTKASAVGLLALVLPGTLAAQQPNARAQAANNAANEGQDQDRFLILH